MGSESSKPQSYDKLLLLARRPVPRLSKEQKWRKKELKRRDQATRKMFKKHLKTLDRERKDEERKARIRAIEERERERQEKEEERRDEEERRAYSAWILEARRTAMGR